MHEERVGEVGMTEDQILKEIHALKELILQINKDEHYIIEKYVKHMDSNDRNDFGLTCGRIRMPINMKIRFLREELCKMRGE